MALGTLTSHVPIAENRTGLSISRLLWSINDLHSRVMIRVYAEVSCNFHGALCDLLSRQVVVVYHTAGCRESIKAARTNSCYPIFNLDTVAFPVHLDRDFMIAHQNAGA